MGRLRTTERREPSGGSHSTPYLPAECFQVVTSIISAVHPVNSQMRALVLNYSEPLMFLEEEAIWGSHLCMEQPAGTWDPCEEWADTLSDDGFPREVMFVFQRQTIQLKAQYFFGSAFGFWSGSCCHQSKFWKCVMLGNNRQPSEKMCLHRNLPAFILKQFSLQSLPPPQQLFQLSCVYTSAKGLN